MPELLRVKKDKDMALAIHQNIVKDRKKMENLVKNSECENMTHMREYCFDKIKHQELIFKQTTDA